MNNILNSQILPFEKKITSKCQNLIRLLLSSDPSKRPSIKELLNSDYVKKMCKKFGWNLEKLVKIKKLKELNKMTNHLFDQTENMSDINNSCSFPVQLRKRRSKRNYKRKQLN